MDGEDGYIMDRPIRLTKPGDLWIILKRVYFVVHERMWRMTGTGRGHYTVVFLAHNYIFMPVPNNPNSRGWRTGNKRRR